MEPKTLKALKSSIKYWNRIMNGQCSMTGAKGCALCRMFRNSIGLLDCSECPIYSFTTFASCGNTPVDEFFFSHDYIITIDGGKKVGGPDSLAGAMAELFFLLTLLPDDAKCPI